MKRIVVFLVGLVVIICFAYMVNPGRSVFETPVIRARLLIEAAVADPEERRDLLADESLVITSPAVIKRAVTIGRLGELASFKDKDVAGILAETLRASPSAEGRRGIEVSFRCPSSSDGIAALRAVLDAYLELRQETGPDEGLELRSYITQLSEQCVASLEAQVARHQDLIADSPFPVLVDYDAALKQRSEDLADRTRTLTTREGLAATLRSRVESLKAVLEKKDNEELLSLFVLNDPAVRKQTKADEITSRLLPLFQQKSELLKRVGPDHPDAVKVRREIVAMREFLGKNPDGKEESLWDFVESYIGALELQLSMLDRELAVLDTKYLEAQESLRAHSEFAVRERQLSDAIATTKRQFNLLADKIEEVHMNRTLRVEIVEPPSVSTGKGPSEQSSWPLILLALPVFVGWAYCCLRIRLPVEDLGDAPIIEFPDFEADVVLDAPSLRQLVAVIQLAGFCESRDQVVILGEGEMADNVVRRASEELERLGRRVSGPHDVTTQERDVFIASSRDWSNHRTDADRMVYVSIGPNRDVATSFADVAIGATHA